MTKTQSPEAGTVTLADGTIRTARRTYFASGAPYIEQLVERDSKSAWRATSPKLARTFKADEA